MRNRFYQVLAKAVLGVLLLVLLGLPLVQTWKMFVFLGGVLALVYSDIVFKKTRIVWCLGIIISILIVKSLLPVAGIEEGHNIFLYSKGGVVVQPAPQASSFTGPPPIFNDWRREQDGKVLQRSLPAQVFNEWRSEFDKISPPEVLPYEEHSWLYRVADGEGSFPDSPYAWSSDAFLRPAKYSRKIDTISFNSLAEFRGGFANDWRYASYGSDAISFARSYMLQLPFFVMFEFSGQSVGCTLKWRGTAYWQKDDGAFEKISHQDFSGRIITAADIGRRVYALSLPSVLPGPSIGDWMREMAFHAWAAGSRFGDAS